MEHEPRMEEIGIMHDQCVCTCGWRSHSYRDGRERAYGEWQEHASRMDRDATNQEALEAGERVLTERRELFERLARR